MYARPSRLPLRLMLLTLMFSIALTGAWTARSAPPVFVTANNIVLQQGNTLPIFPLSAPQVTDDTTRALAQRFSGIYNRQPIASDTYLGAARYTVPFTDTRSLLVRYGATGGYYATNLGELGRESVRGAIDRAQAQRLACLFLRNNGFMDARGRLLLDPQNPQGVLTPNPQGCDFNPDPQNPLYPTSLIRTATVSANTPGAAPTEQDVGVVVRVPMSLPVQFGQRSDLPLGGPGGHLSLLFTTTDLDNGPTLDDAVPGLAGVAMPFFGRQLGQPRNVPIADPNAIRNQVEQQVRASFPGATGVNVPQPELSYYVLDAAVEQRALEPVLEFQGIEVTVGGETVILRDIVAPLARSGAGGFGPAVSITNPANGSPFNPGAEVLLRGEISDGAAPYRVEWLTGDGVTLASATTVTSPGTVELRTRDLPAAGRDGAPTPVTVVLRVTDNEGAVREAQISLRPAVAPTLYLPLIIRERSGAPATAEAILEQVGYGFGVEANWDYPPAGTGGSDLPGVIPDANGFRSGMLGYGYSQRFYWTNSAAWERDWRDCGLGGIDCTLGVDRADFVYYAGHGGPAGLSLASNKDSTWASATNARFNSARWVGFASCQTLRVQGYTTGNEPIRKWFNSFQGAHMLLGFNSNMRDVAFGGRLVENMRMPSFLGIDFPWAQPTIAQAWIKTSFELNAGKIAYIYARSSTVNPVTDRLPKPGQAMPPRPLPVSSYHWVWETF